MSINSVFGATGTTDIGQLVQRLVTAADKNKDGTLSSSEFGSFLNGLIDGMTSLSGDLKSTDPGSVAVATAPVTTVSPAITLPAPAGWDQIKWADPSHHTTKYDVGHVLAKYPPTSAGLLQAWDELSKVYPDAKFDGKDTISGLPGTNGPVDVLVGAGAGGSSWSWQDQGS